MEKPKRGSKQFERTYLTLELVLQAGIGPQRILLYESSSAGTTQVPKAWILDGYLPSAAQITDLGAYVSKLATDASIAFCGVKHPSSGL